MAAFEYIDDESDHTYINVNRIAYVAVDSGSDCMCVHFAEGDYLILHYGDEAAAQAALREIIQKIRGDLGFSHFWHMLWHPVTGVRATIAGWYQTRS